MKIRVIIERASWRYKLAFGRSPSGTWFTKLTNHGGQRVGLIVVTNETRVDALINDADRIYQDLASRLGQFPTASVRDYSKITKPTTGEKETETSAASTAASTGA